MRAGAWRVFAGAILCSVFLVGQADFAAGKSHDHRVLILTSYHPTFPWTGRVVDAIEHVFRAHRDQVEWIIEYMDTKRFNQPEYYEKIYALLKHKTAGQKYDVVITVDNNALLFLLEHRSELCPGVPIVFCGVDTFHDSMYEWLPRRTTIEAILDGHRDVTGVIEELPRAATVETALRIHPSARHVIIVNDGASDNAYWPPMTLEEIADLVREHQGRVRFSTFMLTRENRQQLLSMVSDQKDGCVLILADDFLNSDGQLPFDEAPWASFWKSCDVPSYAVTWELVGHGPVIGGYLNSSYRQGRIAADMALRVADGAKAADIPIVRGGTGQFVFDYGNLKHFGIARSVLPADSLIVNQPRSFYRMYRGQILAAVAVLVGLAVAVMLLAVNILRRRRVEADLRLKQMVVESSLNAIALAGLDGRLTYVNRSFVKLWGYESEDELIGQEVERFWVEPKAAEQVKNTVHRDGVWVGQLKGKRKDGSVFDAELTSNLITDEAGKPVCVMAAFVDVTSRNQARRTLEQYKFVVESAHDAIFFKDLQSRYVLVNSKAAEAFGLRAEEVIGKTDDQLMAERGQAWANIEDDRRVFETGRPITITKEMTDAMGQRRWFQAVKVPQFDEQGNVTGLVGIARDITEQKRVEDALRKAHDELEARVQQRTADLAAVVGELKEEVAQRKRVEGELRKAEHRFRTIFENSLIGIYRTTPDGRILMANPALVKMMGYSSFEELSRLNLERDGFDSSTPRSDFKRMMEKQGKVLGLESVWMRKDGSRLFVCESAVAVRGEDGRMLYYEGTIEDITERKKAEQQLMRYQEQLRSLASELSLAEERMRRQLATNVHDQVGQNLAIAKIKLEALKRSLCDAKLSQAAEEVNEMLSEAIENARSLTFELSPPVLYELGFEAAVQWLARQMQQRHGIVTVFDDDGRKKPLEDDVKVLLFQAVRELLVNITKHSKAHNAKVSTRRCGNEIRITVEDDGVGFDAAGMDSNLSGIRGFGLFSIRERLDHIGGRMKISRPAAGGTRVIMTAPINHKSRRKGAKVR